MTTGLEKMADFENLHKKWRDDAPVDDKRVLIGLLPVAFLFMGLVFGASMVRAPPALASPPHKPAPHSFPPSSCVTPRA